MATPFPVAPVGVPYITTDQMREVDRAMIEDFGITLLQMMENAGRNLGEVVVRTMFDGSQQGKRVLITAGSGGNGGGALAAARHLSNRGCYVIVLLVVGDESRITDAVRHQLSTLEEMGVPVRSVADSEISLAEYGDFDVIIDGLLGYSLNGDPREPVATVIQQVNESGVPVVSNDIPSGIDSTTGKIFEPAVHATATVTIALPKTAFENVDVRRVTGDLFLGDISVPRELYRATLGLVVPEVFTAGPIVKIRDLNRVS